MHREHLASRLGFILLSAGCAIGIGNVWKFPWMTGQYGGGAFVVIYLIFLLILGVPVLTMEFAMGRASQKSPLKMYQTLKPAAIGAGRATPAWWARYSDDVLHHRFRMDAAIFCGHRRRTLRGT